MEFNVAPPPPVTREFLAIVLAGFGNGLVPLSGDLGNQPCPKALLPISNKPMIDYVFSWIEKSGIKDVLLICPPSHRPSISHFIYFESLASSSSLRIDLQTFDDSQGLSIGTCSVLKHFSSRIKEDFVILPCDFIPPPSLSLSKLLNKFRIETMSDGAIVTTCWFEPPSGKTAVPEEWGTNSQVTPIVWDSSTGTLLYVDTLDNTDCNPEELELRMSLLCRYPRTNMSSKMQDSHVYVCKRQVLGVLQQKGDFESLREDFFPWLCKLQYQITRHAKYGNVLGNLEGSEPSSPDEGHEGPLVTGSLRVGVVIHRAKDGFCIRANDLPSYLEANRHFVNSASYSLPSDPQMRSLIDARASISPDSIIGDFTKVDERASIKKSVIGKHCVVSKMAKIVGCIILDHCVIADGAKLESSILGKNTRVGSKATLVHCVTQGGYEVKENESYRNERLDITVWEAEADEEQEEEEEGDSDEESS
ncbi:nucleotide-diphospho-sugar transferase [Pisolithus croceorrhizus]|nr:nucleotide-diphospho-sugar transferase [Pisolithus croceorrhizus]